MASANFAIWHKADRNFALAFVIAAWAVVLIGFYPAVSGRWRGEADYAAPAILQVHVFSFVGWLCLLTGQVMLIRAGRREWHRKFGLGAALLIPLLVVTGLGAETYSQRFYSPQSPGNLRFFIFPLTTMVSFALVAVAAIWFRANTTAHKRLIMLGTSLILVAAFNRWWGEGIYEMMGDEYWGTLVRNCIGPDLMIAVLLLYDLVTRCRVHPALAIAVPPILAAQFAEAAIYHSDWWPGVARTLAGVPG